MCTTLQVCAVNDDCGPPVRRGSYRTSPAKWFHPTGSVPQGSAPANIAMRSPMARASSGGGGGGWQAQLAFSADLAPLTLAFTVHVPAAAESSGGGGKDVSVSGHSGRPFAIPVGMGAGSPEFLGATPHHAAAVPDQVVTCSLRLASVRSGPFGTAVPAKPRQFGFSSVVQAFQAAALVSKLSQALQGWALSPC